MVPDWNTGQVHQVGGPLEIQDGINWYNADSIYSGSPAGPHDFLGWSGQDTSWQDSRYKLDEIKDGTDSDTLVRFRIGFPFRRSCLQVAVSHLMIFGSVKGKREYL